MPGVLIMKDFTMYLVCEQNLHGENWSFGPAELFGFNAGSTPVDKVRDLQGNWRKAKNNLPFNQS